MLDEQPNAGPHLRRWRACEARRATAHHTHEKRARFEAAPAASGAGQVGPQHGKWQEFLIDGCPDIFDL